MSSPSADLAVWTLAVVLGAGAVLWLPAWRRTRVVVTVAHELGHALGGVFAGRRLHALRVRLDTSGVTHTIGRRRGLGMVVCAWAGYPAPAIAGLAAVLVAVRGWAEPALLVLAVLFAGCLLWARSAFTVLVLLACAGAAAALWWWAPPVVQSGTAVGVGVFLVLGGLRVVVDAWRGRRTGLGSDAHVLADLTVLPPGFWVATFWLVTVGCAVGAAWMLGDAVREVSDGWTGV